MTAKSKKPTNKRRRPLGTTPEDVENHMVSLAMGLAREQLEAGTASSQVITHFLKLGTERARLEAAKLEHENTLLQAKTEQIKSQSTSEALMRDAIKAFSGYKPSESDLPDEVVAFDV